MNSNDKADEKEQIHVILCHFGPFQDIEELYLLLIFALLTVPCYIVASLLRRCEAGSATWFKSASRPSIGLVAVNMAEHVSSHGKCQGNMRE